MTELAFEHARHFPRTDLAADTVLVVPNDSDSAPAVRQLQRLIAAESGRAPDIVQERDFTDTLFRDAQVIACGHMANNAALRRLYTARCSFVDTFFPGGDGYFVKSISDPFGYGKNCIAVGASTREGLHGALAAFEDVVRAGGGALDRVHAARFGHALPAFPDESQLERMVQEDLDTWDGGWVSSPFRGGKLPNYAWHYYLTDHPVWGRAVPAIFAGSLAPWRAQRRDKPESYHCFFHFDSLIRIWDLIEDSPLYVDEDRRGVVEMLGEQLRHLAGLFYLGEEANPPGQIRQNHTTYIALDLAVGHDYMQRCYGIEEFEPTEAVVERIFAGQADCYKVNDDGGVGYAWLVPQETLAYQLFKKGDCSYIENGHIADLCNLAVVTTDNMRSEGNYGDTSGYSLFSSQGWQGRLWPLMVSTWHNRDARHLWMLNWLGEGKRPTLERVLQGLYSGVEWTEDGFGLEGCTPEEPLDLLGIYAMELPAKAVQWVGDHMHAAHRPQPQKSYFDKLSLRRNFAPADEYLLLEGTGTFCHGHEDANAIIRLTWNDRAWLGDGDYIRAAPKFHSSIAVVRDGVGVLDAPGEGLLMPPLASLNYSDESTALGLVQTEVARYNGVDWRRNIFWSKARYFAVIDQLHCTIAGDYRCRCLWRMVGEAELEEGSARLHQQGEHFYIRNGDGAAQEIVPDFHEKSRWTTYPHAGDVLHVLHQKSSRTMQPGENIAFLNLLTPHGDIRLERLDELAIKIGDGAATSVLGVGSMHLGALAIEAAMFGISLEGDVLTLQGIERLGFVGEGDRSWVDLHGVHTTLQLGSSDLARRIRDAIEALEPSPPPSVTAPYLERPEGIWRQRWMREMGPSEIGAVDVGEDFLLAGTEEGDVVQLNVRDGVEVWKQRLHAAASTLLQADIDGDGVLEVLVGTTESKLLVLEGCSGTLRWDRLLKNMWARGAGVSGLAAADLEGRGELSVLAGTQGWYVNAFSADGTPKWADWVRYHAITGLIVADADGDGRVEIVVGTEYSTPLNVHNWDGSLRWSTFEEVGSEGNATTPRRGIGLKHLLLNDVDGDGVQEIVYGTEDGWIYAVKPQDGAEVWRASIVGEVRGLIAHSAGLIAAGEFGELYFFSWGGEMFWHVQVADWIRAIAPVGDGVAAAVEEGVLLGCDLDGRCVACIPLEAEIRGLWPCDGGILCSLEGGRLSCMAWA